MKKHEISIRDPFILPCEEEKAYYLFGTTAGAQYPKAGFYHFKSYDLEEWEGPFESFIPDDSFWSHQDYWAPEVHAYKGKYYMFATFKSETRHRGTQILVSDTPGGLFQPLTAGPVTPSDWECLDGTLYVEEDGTPYIVFCHEWTQIRDGEIAAMPLTADLKTAAGEPVVLFKASESGWSCEFPGRGEYVTDGPFLFRHDGKLKMLWSSFRNGEYAMGCAYSTNGRISGEWLQEEELIFTEDGGHGMLFEAFDGKKYFSLHRPNCAPEHPILLEAVYLEDTAAVRRSMEKIGKRYAKSFEELAK